MLTVKTQWTPRGKNSITVINCLSGSTLQSHISSITIWHFHPTELNFVVWRMGRKSVHFLFTSQPMQLKIASLMRNWHGELLDLRLGSYILGSALNCHSPCAVLKLRALRNCTPKSVFFVFTEIIWLGALMWIQTLRFIFFQLFLKTFLSGCRLSGQRFK